MLVNVFVYVVHTLAVTKRGKVIELELTQREKTKSSFLLRCDRKFSFFSLESGIKKSYGECYS